MTESKPVTRRVDKSNTKYICNISFTTTKNFSKLFQEKKFLRIITLNNMNVGDNNMFIICDNKDVEASIGDLNLSCHSESAAKQQLLALQEEVKQLREENKKLKGLLAKIKHLLG